MILKRRAALDGVQLDSIDSRILIQKIEPAAGKETIDAASIWDGSGSRVTGMHRDSLDIVVSFSINEKSYRPQARAEVLEKVNTWAAAGGWLTVNYKPGRKIRVMAAQLPGEGDALQRNQYSITFRAYGVPYWQETEPETLGLSGTSSGGSFSAEGTYTVGGNQRTAADASFQNTGSGTINSLTIRAGESTVTFTGLGLAAGETLTIDHPDDGKRSLMRCRIGSRSAMAKRTAGSANDLWVEPGAQSVGCTADGAGTLEVTIAGRFA